MSASWKLFKLVCFVQMLITVYFTFTAFISLFQSGEIYYFFETLAFILMTSMAIMALNVLGNNYPDKPIAGTQKIIFNWLFLLNFLLIAFLFGLFFAEYGQLKALSRIMLRPLATLPFTFFVPFLAIIMLLIFQFIILYGMYAMRRLLYINFFTKKQFEFEERGSGE
jgi:hypothetical protein